MPQRETAAFFRAFLTHPRRVGAVLPSGRALAAAMVRDLDEPLRGGRTIVEFGPGTGSFTSAILRALPQGSSYVGIELDRHFVHTLRRRFPDHHHPQAHFVHGSAEHAADLLGELCVPDVGVVVCGLPFASLPIPVQRRIVRNIDTLLEGGGAFRTFQYVHASMMRAAKKFREQMDACFGHGRRSKAVVGNVPPAFVLEWQRVGVAANAG